MDFLWDKITEWLKELLVSGVISNLTGLFDATNQKVGEIAGQGEKMTNGTLEMSNVDLSAEFTEMITTQRGFQANSRIITTSDSLLEELVNLKR